MSSVIDDDDKSKQRTEVIVVFYRKEYVAIYEVKDFSIYNKKV